MVSGDLILTNHGVFELSAAGLKTKVDTLNILALEFISGARLHFVPAGNGQVRLLEVAVEQ